MILIYILTFVQRFIGGLVTWQSAPELWCYSPYSVMRTAYRMLNTALWVTETLFAVRRQVPFLKRRWVHARAGR